MSCVWLAVIGLAGCTILHLFFQDLNEYDDAGFPNIPSPYEVGIRYANNAHHSQAYPSNPYQFSPPPQQHSQQLSHYDQIPHTPHLPPPSRRFLSIPAANSGHRDHAHARRQTVIDKSPIPLLDRQTSSNMQRYNTNNTNNTSDYQNLG